MPQIHRRKGKRNSVESSTPIVVFVYGLRIEGCVCDTSSSGLGVLLPANTGLEERQQVRVLYEGRRQMAVVVSVRAEPDGERVGLKLL